MIDRYAADGFLLDPGNRAGSSLGVLTLFSRRGEPLQTAIEASHVNGSAFAYSAEISLNGDYDLSVSSRRFRLEEQGLTLPSIEEKALGYSGLGTLLPAEIPVMYRVSGRHPIGANAVQLSQSDGEKTAFAVALEVFRNVSRAQMTV